MLVNLGAPGLVGTVGCATVQVDGCRCISLVRGPSQLSGFEGDSADSRSCATGELRFSVVRAPFANREKSDKNSELFPSNANQQQQQQQQSVTAMGGIIPTAADNIAAMVHRAVDRSVVFESLPLARFDLIVQVLSSTDDTSDLQGITAAACAALVDAAIPLRDVFGASSSKSDASGAIQTIVAAHTGEILGMSSTGSFAPEELCATVEKCASDAKTATISAFTNAAGRAVAAAREKELMQKNKK